MEGRGEVRKERMRVPEIVGAVFICDEEDGDFRVRGDGVDAAGGGGVVFSCVCGEGFEERFSGRRGARQFMNLCPQLWREG